MALRVFDAIGEINVQFPQRAVAFLVSRDEGKTVTGAEVRDQSVESVVELFGFVTQDLAAGLVSQVLNVEVMNATNPAHARGPTHHPVLRYLFGRLRNDGGNNATRLEHGMHRGLTRWSTAAVPVTRHPSNHDDHAATGRITGLHHVIRRIVEGDVQTMVSALVMW